MYEQTNTMMETKTTFQIPQLLDGDDFTSEDLADDMEGLRLSFTRIKIPGGGHLQFEIPSGNPDVPDYAPYLEGVILYSHNSNAYWPEGSEYDDDQPPLCQSFDGKVGYGEPGGTCADCVLNQFGSDGNNKGKACKNMRMLYLLRSGEYMPIQIALPPTSLTPYKVECYPNTPAIKVQLLPVNAGERITMTQNLGQPLPRYQAFLCDGMLEVDSTAFMDYMEENDLGYIVDYKRYNADVFTGVNRRTAAVFQFHSAALRRLNKVGCQRYEGDYTRLKQKHAERRARRMAG